MDHVVVRHGGRAGFVHIFPNSVFAALDPPLLCNAYLVAPASTSPKTGIWFGHISKDGDPEARKDLDDKLEMMRQTASNQGFLGDLSANLATDDDLRMTAKMHAFRAKRVVDLMLDNFGGHSEGTMILPPVEEGQED